MHITLIQMTPNHAADDNRRQADRLIRSACAGEKPDLIVLPEVWSCLGGTIADKRGAAETLPETSTADAGPLYGFLRGIAMELGVAIHGGSIGEIVGDRLFNTSLVFAADGKEIARYRKIHLFDMVTSTGEQYRESSVYKAGSEVVTFELAGVIVGCTICYDLRFGYLFDALRAAGAELIVLPAAFTAETGRAHWEVMVRARAIETQCWLAAAATTGSHLDADRRERSTFGHSMICDPWGRVVATAGREPGWISAVMDRTVTRQVRERMPLWEHRVALARTRLEASS